MKETEGFNERYRCTGSARWNRYLSWRNKFGCVMAAQLDYAEFGDPKGKPVFFFHRLPGSRLFRHPDNSIATSLGVRLITVDRPDFGLSAFKSGRQLLDWPDDVLELAETLDFRLPI